MTRYIRGISIYKPARRCRRMDPYLMSWLEAGKRRTKTGSTSLDITIRKAGDIALRLDAMKLGLVDIHAGEFARAEDKPLAKHVVDYRQHLMDCGATKSYAEETGRLCLRILEAAGIVRVSEITENRIQHAIAQMTPLRTTAGGTLSLRQKDKAVRAMKAFAHWLKKSKRAPSHMLSDLVHYDPEQDRRRIRRVISEADLVKLIETTKERKSLGKMTGIHRAMLYTLAIGTGFRFSTLVSLRPVDFDFSGSPALIMVEARNIKSRKRIEHPIRNDLAEVMKTYLAKLDPKAPIFTPSKRWNEVFQKDLAAAGIDSRDASGHVFDFHATRNQYITAVVRAAGLAVAQDLAHHSTPVLTKRYARMNFDDYGKGLDALPKLQKAQDSRVKKTAG